jgi:predicted DNA-binding transcriptional regulator AlpA
MQTDKPQPEKPQRRTDGIAREAERREMTGVPLSTWHVMQNQGKAPKPVRLGLRSVGWLASVRRRPQVGLMSWGDQAASAVRLGGCQFQGRRSVIRLAG